MKKKALILINKISKVAVCSSFWEDLISMLGLITEATLSLLSQSLICVCVCVCLASLPLSTHFTLKSLFPQRDRVSSFHGLPCTEHPPSSSNQEIVEHPPSPKCINCLIRGNHLHIQSPAPLLMGMSLRGVAVGRSLENIKKRPFVHMLFYTPSPSNFSLQQNA